jgi:GTP-binding protein
MLVKECSLLLSATTPDRFPRDGAPQIAFMGRSNVGKSSLINRMLGTRGLARTSKTPGRTRAIHFYRVNRRIDFVDLPGYGYARVPRPMREEWKGLVEAYLEGAMGAPGPDLAVVLVDARHPPTDMDQELVDWLRSTGRKARIVLTKIDKLPRGQWKAAVAAAATALGAPPDALPIPVSAVTGEGIPALWRVVDAACERTRGDSTPPQPLSPPHIPQGEGHHRERQRHRA